MGKLLDRIKEVAVNLDLVATNLGIPKYRIGRVVNPDGTINIRITPTVKYVLKTQGVEEAIKFIEKDYKIKLSEEKRNKLKVKLNELKATL
jgi:hypothetical protein